MNANGYSEDIATEGASAEVEYLDRGRQMVRELELFLRTELAYPREERRISFVSARRDAAIGAVAIMNPVKE